MIRWLVGRMAHHAPSSDVEKGTAMCVITVTSRGPHRSADHMLDPRARVAKSRWVASCPKCSSTSSTCEAKAETTGQKDVEENAEEDGRGVKKVDAHQVASTWHPASELRPSPSQPSWRIQDRCNPRDRELPHEAKQPCTGRYSALARVEIAGICDSKAQAAG